MTPENNIKSVKIRNAEEYVRKMKMKLIKELKLKIPEGYKI